MLKNLRQNAAVLIVITVFFVLSLAAATHNAGSIQTSRKSKTTPTPAAAKKNAKPTPTPNKKSQAKSEPTSKKTQPATAKNKKDADKKTTNSKATAKDSPKDKTARDKTAKGKASDKTKEAASKQNAAAKSIFRTASKKTGDKTASDKKNVKTQTAKSDSKSSSKNSKQTVTSTKNDSSPSTTRTASAKSIATKTSAPKTSRVKSSSRTAETPSDEVLTTTAPQIIVTDIAARIRSQAKANAPELRQAKLGTILQVSEKTPAWYRVKFASANGKTSSGWISANSVNDLNSAAKDQLYRQIADRYYKTNGMDFATASELYEFLSRAADEPGVGAAELELKRLLALRSALKAIPSGSSNQSQYRDFLKDHEKSVVYSEPAGVWLVNSKLFWDLHKKYEKSAIADQIAWEAAQNPLPGECEGYVNCYLFYARMTSGEYLSLHPTGRKNLEALTNLTNYLEPIAASLNGQSVYTGPTDVTDRAEFNNLIAELRTIISRLPLVEKEKPLQQLRKIAEGFR